MNIINVDIKDVLPQLFNMPTRIVIVIFLSSAFFLLSPDSWLERLNLATFENEYGHIIGLVTVITFFFLLARFSVGIISEANKINGKRKFEANKLKKLKNLNSYQKSIIRELYLAENHTIQLPEYDGAVKELKQATIIGMVTDTIYTNDISSINNPIFPYHLQPWVIDCLNENDELKELYSI